MVCCWAQLLIGLACVYAVKVRVFTQFIASILARLLKWSVWKKQTQTLHILAPASLVSLVIFACTNMSWLNDYIWHQKKTVYLSFFFFWLDSSLLLVESLHFFPLKVLNRPLRGSPKVWEQKLKLIILLTTSGVKRSQIVDHTIV